MANHKSSEKRARQTLRKTARNTTTKKTVKTAERKVVAAITAKAKDAETNLREFTSRIMKAVSKGALAKTTAARKISRLSKRVQQLTSSK